MSLWGIRSIGPGSGSLKQGASVAVNAGGGLGKVAGKGLIAIVRDWVQNHSCVR